MATARVTIDIDPIAEAVLGILNRAGSDWYQAARKEVPVRKPNQRTDQAGSRSQAFNVRLIGTSRGLSGPQTRLRRDLSTMTPKTRAEYIENLRGFAERSKVAKLFRYTEGPMKGKAPEVITARGRKVAGAEVTRGGTLRDGIEFVPAKREGNLVTIVLQNKVPYAKFVHDGFKHKGGKQVKERRFMAGPRDNLILPALRAGDYNRG